MVGLTLKKCLKSAMSNCGNVDGNEMFGCTKNDVIPKFLLFKLATSHFKNSNVYKKCKIRLLEEEIKSKKKRINTLEKGAQRVKEELQGTLSEISINQLKH